MGLLSVYSLYRKLDDIFSSNYALFLWRQFIACTQAIRMEYVHKSPVPTICLRIKSAVLIKSFFSFHALWFYNIDSVQSFFPYM